MLSLVSSKSWMSVQIEMHSPYKDAYSKHEMQFHVPVINSFKFFWPENSPQEPQQVPAFSETRSHEMGPAPDQSGGLDHNP